MLIFVNTLWLYMNIHISCKNAKIYSKTIILWSSSARKAGYRIQDTGYRIQDTGYRISSDIWYQRPSRISSSSILRLFALSSSCLRPRCPKSQEVVSKKKKKKKKKKQTTANHSSARSRTGWRTEEGMMMNGADCWWSWFMVCM